MNGRGSVISQISSIDSPLLPTSVHSLAYGGTSSMRVQLRGGRVAAAVLLALIVSACGGAGGSDASEGDKPAEPRSEQGGVLTAGQLSSVLLNATDLPEGYQLDASPDEDEDDTDFGTSECATQLEDFAGQGADANIAAEVERAFDTGEDGFTTLEQSASSSKDEDALKDSLDTFGDIINECGQITFASDGQPATLTVSKVDVPEHGDDTLGVRMKGQISAFSIELVIGINRLGHNLHMVTVGGLGDADMPALQQAMDTGFARLEQAHKVAKDAPIAAAEPAAPAASPSSTLRTGGPGTYTATSEDGVAIELMLPAPASAPLAGEVAGYLKSVGGEFADVTLVQVTLTNNGSEEIYPGGVTIVTADGTQTELTDMVELLNDTEEVNPDAYSNTGGDLNSEFSDKQISALKPRAKATQLYALRGVEPADVVDVYVSAGGPDVQLGLS